MRCFGTKQQKIDPFLGRPFVLFLAVPTGFEPAERNWFSAHLPAVQAKHRYQWISNPHLRVLCRSKLEAQPFGKALLGIWGE